MRRKILSAAVLLTLLACLGGCRVATLGLMESGVQSKDGLGLKFDITGKVTAVTLDKKELPAGLARTMMPGGFYMRDAGGGNVEILGGVRRTDGGMVFSASPAGLDLWAVFEPKGDCIEVRGRITNPSGSERGVTIGFALPVHAEGWVFGRSINSGEPITTNGTYAEWTCADSDWDGRQMNRGMITPIYSELAGLALGATSDHPQIFRVSYKDGRGFVIETDLGLSPIPRKFHNTATFKFVMYRFDGRQKYRGALAKYYRMFPENYQYRDISSATLTSIYPGVSTTCRLVPFLPPASTQPSLPVSTIRRAINLYWSAQPVGSAAQAEVERERYTFGPDGQMRLWGIASTDGLDRKIFPIGSNAAAIPMNPDTELAQPSLAWKALSAALFNGPKSGDFGLGPWDDSAGRYLENYRPSHLAVVDYPLTYSQRTGRPVQFHAFMWREFAQPLAEFLHAHGGVLSADSRPWRMSVMFDQPLIDVHVAASLPEREIGNLAHLRSLVGGKFIGGILGDDTAKPATFSPRQMAQAERDLNGLLPYAVLPGGEWPDALRQKYVNPMLAMTAAGWEPLAGAVVIHPDLLVERFGGPDSSKVFYAVHNRGEVPIAYEMAIDLALVKIDPKTIAVTDRIAGLSPEATTIEKSLVLRSAIAGRGTNLFELSRTGGNIPANATLKMAESPRKSTVAPLAKFDAKKVASKQFAATMDRLGMDIRPKTAERFLGAYMLEKRELANAIAFHLRREAPKDNLDAIATELANWLAPRFDSIYESVLPAPTMATWSAMRAKSPLAAKVKLVGDQYQVEVFDPLLEQVK
ncbi:MAG: hypothetical protein PHU85_05045 [Phycisphaerae bacterium]|nr:hypothetical protein [Phycisphaerae bacterium]